MQKELNTHTLEELRAQRQALDETIKDLERHVVADLEAQARALGLTLAPATAPQRPTARYRNPDNPEETYGGKGKRPQWLQAKLDAGHQIEEFRVN